jgi:hypothetical protein
MQTHVPSNSQERLALQRKILGIEDWASTFNHQGFSFEQRLRLVQCVIDRSSSADEHLGNLGAGPIEDLLSDEFMSHVERDQKNIEIWRAAIRHSYWQMELPDFAARISRLLNDRA